MSTPLQFSEADLVEGKVVTECPAGNLPPQLPSLPTGWCYNEEVLEMEPPIHRFSLARAKTNTECCNCECSNNCIRTSNSTAGGNSDISQSDVVENEFNDIYAFCEKHGKRATIATLMKNYYKMSSCIYREAIENNRFDIVKWVYDNGIPKSDWDTSPCESAAYAGRIDILKWLRDRHFPWGGDVYAEAIDRGHFDVVQWAYANGCPMSTLACATAAYSGRLDIIKWLHKNNFPWDIWTYYNAKNNNHQDIMDFYTSTTNFVPPSSPQLLSEMISQLPWAPFDIVM